MPTASRARSWRWPCPCSSRSRPAPTRRWPIASAPSRRASAGASRALTRAFEEAARLAGEEGLLALIVPPSLRGGEAPALFDETRMPMLTPREAKGMEFDHVVVVEPAAIVDEALGGQGLRELYVALTRPTRTLVVVHERPLPAALGQRERNR